MGRYHHSSSSSLCDGLDDMAKTAVIVGVGFVLGCYLGSYFLAACAVVVMVVVLVHHT